MPRLRYLCFVAMELSPADIQRLATLARLQPSPQQAAQYQTQLAAILTYAQRLGELKLDGVEPLTSPLDMPSPLGADVPGPTLPTSTLMAMAPERHEPFIKVPKVLGGDAGESGA